MAVVENTNDAGQVVRDLATSITDMAQNKQSGDMAFNTGSHVCSSTTGNCPENGVMCGTTCCYPAEWCDPTTLKCNCGNNGPCPSEQYLCTSLTGPPNPGTTCGDTCTPTL